jgi:hemoglobin
MLTAFLIRVGEDPLINARFADSDLVRLQGLLQAQLCEASGGYCSYTGLSMVEAHAGMCISADEFTAMAGDLTGAMDDVGVAYTAPDFSGGLAADALVLGLLGMAPEIVEDPEGDGCELDTEVDTADTPDGGSVPGGVPTR